MKKEKLLYLHCYILTKYCTDMKIVLDAPDNDFGSYIPEKVVSLPKNIFSNTSEWSLFAFLHEVGHIKTNTTSMKRCEQEYLATQWAIEEAKEIGFKIPKRFISTYQNYIWRWRETGIKHKAKSIPSKEALTLVY